MSEIDFVRLDEGWRERFEALDAWTWPSSFSIEQRTRLPFSVDWQHTIGLADGDRLAAKAAFYPFHELAIPGGRIRANGLTSVSVHPNYRRQGLLRRMIGRYLEAGVTRGDGLSMLFAQDYEIYGRFGFGHASDSYNLRIPHGTRLIAPDGYSADDFSIDFDYADPGRDAPFIHQIQQAQTRPGTPVRELPGFQQHALTSEFAPGQPLRILRVARGDEPAGYALFTRPHISDRAGIAPVTDWNALDAGAEYALWQAMADVDLVRIVEAQRVPVDSPLVFMLPDPRAATPGVQDDLFARILDLPVCLASRRYEADLDLVLQIDDPLLPINHGLWRMVISGGRAEVNRAAVGAAADVSLSISQLSAAYLGRPVLAGMARADQIVEHVAGSADLLHRAMSWPVQPAATWVF